MATIVRRNTKQHFVKFSRTSQTFLANIVSAAPGDSEALQTEAAKRLTRGGQLTYTRFVNREQPDLPTIGIQGDGFAAEAVLDKSRPDTIFVFRVSQSPRDDRLNGVSQSACLSLQWLPQIGNPPELEYAGYIFAGLQQGHRIVPPRPKARLELLPEVQTALAELGVDLRAQLMAAQLQAGSDAAPDLKTLRDAWRTYVQRSGRSPAAVRAADRMERILSGEVTPKDVPLPHLWTTLQRVVLSRTLPEAKSRPAELNAIVRAFVESRLASEQTVALLWQASLSGADLSVLESALVGLGATWKQAEPREEQPWWDALCAAYEKVGGRGTDSEIGNLIESIDREDQSVITAVIAWAEKRESKDSAPVEMLTPAEEPPVGDLSLLAGRLDEAEIEGWIERVEGPPGVDAARVGVQELARDLMTWGEADTPTLITCLNELHERTTQFLQEHELLFSDPRTKGFAELRASAKRQLGQAFERIQEKSTGVEHFRAALQKDTTPTRLLRAAELLVDPLVSVLPSWWWQGEPFEQLLEERIANDTQSLIELIGELEEGQRLRLTAQPVPAAGTDPIDYLLDLVTDIKEGLGDDGEKYPGLAKLYENGSVDRAAFKARVTDLDYVLGALLPTFEEAARSYCLPTDSAGESLDRIRNARKAVEDLRMSGDQGPFRWPEVLRQIPQKASDAQHHAGPQVLALGYANVRTWYMLDGDRVTVPDRPPLLFSADENPPFGSVVVPLVIKADKPGDLVLQIGVVFGTAGLSKGFPADVAARVSPASLTLRKRDWYSSEGGYTATFPLTIPLRRPEDGDELSFRVTISAEGQNVATSEFNWSNWIIEQDGDQPGPKWTDGENPAAAASAPIGLQANLEAILGRLMNGQSSIAMAPRRFGKSSLLALIGQRIATAITVNCGLFLTQGGIDHQSVWEDVTRKLRNSHTGVPELSKLEDARSKLLPWLVEKNLRLVLLFDEAQYLFDGAGPGEVQLWRDVLIHAEGRLAICFVGLPRLRQVAETDLAGVALPYENTLLPDEQLARLVRHMAGSEFYTTVAARQRLARLATNLHILKVLVERLDQLASEQRRRWVSEEDVVRVEEDLKRELTHRRLADGISTYLADALNAGTPNRVRLLDAAPVAVVYALALEDGQYGATARESTKATLELWSKEAGEERALSLDTVGDALKQLMKNGLLKEAGHGRGLVFASELQRCFFVGAAQDLRDDAVWGTGANIAQGGTFNDALLRFGIPRVELPLPLTPLGGGAQADTFTFDRQNTKMVARVRSLVTDEERRVFLRHLQTADIIRGLHDTNDPSAAGIYKLKELGLNAKNEQQAVETYPFIDGLVLSEKECSVAEVVDLGISLGQALAVLHERGILHRDIAPRNIIVQPGGHPVLIDFGLACIDAIANHTRLAGEYAAPEVLRATPMWTTAADVFALARTLNSVLAPQGTFHDWLKKLLTSITEMNPESRQNVKDVLVTPFKELQNRLAAAEPVERLLNVLRPLTDGDEALRTAVLADNGAIKQLRSVALGYATSEAQRRRVIADLVDLYLKHKFGGGSSVGALIPSNQNPNAPLQRTDGLSALQTLRNDTQHPTNRHDDSKDAQLRRARLQSAHGLGRDQFVGACETIANHAGSPNLVMVVRKVLDWPDT